MSQQHFLDRCSQDTGLTNNTQESLTERFGLQRNLLWAKLTCEKIKIMRSINCILIRISKYRRELGYERTLG
jgi:hypothetical protein